jgi:hypothetical protein
MTPLARSPHLCLPQVWTAKRRRGGGLPVKGGDDYSPMRSPSPTSTRAGGGGGLRGGEEVRFTLKNEFPRFFSVFPRGFFFENSDRGWRRKAAIAGDRRGRGDPVDGDAMPPAAAELVGAVRDDVGLEAPAPQRHQVQRREEDPRLHPARLLASPLRRRRRHHVARRRPQLRQVRLHGQQYEPLPRKIKNKKTTKIIS